MAACGSGGSADTSSDKVSDAVAVDYSVDKENSVVSWSGEVAGVYGHNGVIDISEGSISVIGDSIVGGKIVINMTTIQPRDSASYKDEDGRRASDLVGHLSTGDFFLVESFPTSSFIIKKHEGNKLIGDLTVRGITKEETATITSIENGPEGFKATADLVFDRQDYKVSWVHFMKDMVLSDDIKIGLEIYAKP